MGWNTTDLLVPDDTQQNAEESPYYYFVHSYCAKYDLEEYPQVMTEWAYTTTQYGNELFVSIVKKGNIFATQFHPEKSGPAGLKLIDEWLRNPQLRSSQTPPTSVPVRVTPKPEHRFTKRIIACMDVRANDEGDLVVTKGDQYDVREKLPSPSTFPSNITATSAGKVRNLGKPISLAHKYYTLGADELCLLNITSFRHSPLQDQPMLSIVRAASQHVFVPLTIGGGIKDTIDPDGTKRSALEVAEAYFRAGADKVSIGSEAVYAVERLLRGEKMGDGEGAIESIARAYGRQAVVVSIDPKRAYVDPSTYSGPYKNELIYGSPTSPDPSERNKAWWYQCTVSGGRETRPLSVPQLAIGAEQLGAGEILINSIDRDGTGKGFDLDLINLVKKNVKIPVVASSGAGKVEHFVEVFEGTGVEAALAAGIFHREEVGIGEVKDALRDAGINARV
jgi:glutamine amidotransferase/cyclase